jgi:hypothetical protein
MFAQLDLARSRVFMQKALRECNHYSGAAWITG